MRNKTYLAVFEPAEGGAYSVYFPHVLGCVSYGKDFIDAQKMAKEALELHVYGMEKDGEKLEAYLARLRDNIGQGDGMK